MTGWLIPHTIWYGITHFCALQLYHHFIQIDLSTGENENCAHGRVFAFSESIPFYLTSTKSGKEIDLLLTMIVCYTVLLYNWCAYFQIERDPIF